MSRTKTLLLALIFFTHPLLSIACGNEFYTTAELPVQANRLELYYLLRHSDNQLPYWSFGFGPNIFNRRNQLARQITGKKYQGGQTDWHYLEQALEKNMDYKLLSDFAWYELRVGSKSNAVRLLERLYEKYPDEYNIVANLGTAYEVTGKNEQALMLLKKAVAINPQSHHGSEWIHVNILEQKIKASPDHAAIIGLGSGQDYPRWLTGKTYDKPIKPDSLMVQLAYQLHERISFIRPPDPIVGQLVFDFADLVAIAHPKEKAKEFYEYAVRYYPALAAAANTRLNAKADTSTANVSLQAGTQSSIGKQQSTSDFWWWYVAIPVLAAAIIIFGAVRRKKLTRQ